MSSIYELTADYLRLMEMMDDPELDPRTLADTMEAIDGELEDKADGYAMVMKNLQADVEALKAEEERLYNRRKAIENNIKAMKERLQMAMQMTGKVKFKTTLFSFGIQKNPASVVLDSGNYEDYPEEFLIEQPPKIDKADIKEALKAGEDLGGLAHLEQTEGVRIR